MPIFWRDYVRPAENLDTLQERRKDVYGRIDKEKFGWKVVLVAGAGFLTDAYDIFAVNMILPMLDIVYWQDKLPANKATAINLATLIGTLIGQLSFGIFADRYGRKKMYGYELLIIIVATVGLALCSKGARGSVNILAWVISWRLLMGIGIGADYPLSAVIVSEFSPRRSRARMLATVFYMQPVGQCLANVVAIITTASSHRHLSQNAEPSNCLGDCMEATDRVWRWIVGLGAVPPAFALLARLLIPESPRYLLEVEKDSSTAQENVKKYFTNPIDPFQKPVKDDDGIIHAEQRGSPVTGDGVDHGATAQGALFSPDSSSQRQDQLPEGDLPIGATKISCAASTTEGPDVIESYGPPSADHLLRRTPSIINENRGYPISSQGSSVGKGDIDVHTRSIVPSVNQNEKIPPSSQPNGPNPNNQDDGGARQKSPEKPKSRKASWKEFWNGFRDYLIEPDSSPVLESEGENIISRVDGQAEPSMSAAPGHHWSDANWTDLAATSLSWFLLDLAFFFLGINSWKITAKIWDTPVYTSVYQLIIQFSWRALITVSVSSLIGGALFIAMAKYRYSLQVYGFLILAAFFVATGASFAALLGGRYFAVSLVLYFFTHIFFDFGPNTSTFIIPAEVFPTQYRATCHGISAAAGKLGSIFAQIIAYLFLNEDRSNKLGFTLIGFSAVMVLGAILTKVWVPNPCDIDGNSRSLEELAKGKRARKRMEEEERLERRRARQARHGHV